MTKKTLIDATPNSREYLFEQDGKTVHQHVYNELPTLEYNAKVRNEWDHSIIRKEPMWHAARLTPTALIELEKLGILKKGQIVDVKRLKHWLNHGDGQKYKTYPGMV